MSEDSGIGVLVDGERERARLSLDRLVDAAISVRTSCSLPGTGAQDAESILTIARVAAFHLVRLEVFESVRAARTPPAEKAEIPKGGVSEQIHALLVDVAEKRVGTKAALARIARFIVTTVDLAERKAREGAT